MKLTDLENALKTNEAFLKIKVPSAIQVRQQTIAVTQQLRSLLLWLKTQLPAPAPTPVPAPPPVVPPVVTLPTSVPGTPTPSTPPPSTRATWTIDKAGWATAGQVFPKGWATNGVQVGDLPTQIDVKNRWPDGSLRFAILTVKAAAAGSHDLKPTGAPVAKITPSWPKVETKLVIAGKTWIASFAPSTDKWLDGPLVQEVRHLATPMDRTTPHPFLRVLYDVRACGTEGFKVDVTVQNTLDVVASNRLTITPSIEIDGQVVYAHAAVDEPWAMRWRQVLYTGTVKEAVATPALDLFIAAGAIPQFLTSIPTGGYALGTGGQWDILQVGLLEANMPAPGGRAEIGPYPDWTARYLAHKDPRVRAFMLKQADLAGSWSVHFTKADGASVISIDEQPRWCLGDGPLNRGAGGGALSGLQLADNAHVPSLVYVPYLLTGDRFYADEMAFWANFVLLFQPPDENARNGSAGLLQLDQARGIAWGLRNMVDAAAYLPDTHPMKSYFVQKVQNNLAWADAYRATPAEDFPFSPTLEFGFDVPGGQALIMGQWQNNFLAWSIQHAHDQGFQGGGKMIDRIVKYQLRLFTSPEWPRHHAGPYFIAVAMVGVGYYTTLKDIHKATFDIYQEGAFPPFSEAYGLDARLALMLAEKRGMAGAKDALTYLMAQPGMVDYVNNRSGFALAAV